MAGKLWYIGARNGAGCTSFPPDPLDQEVIIRKNAEQGPENRGVCRREYMRSYLAAFGGQKSGPDVV